VFTGLVQDLGTVDDIELTQDGVRIAIDSGLGDQLSAGDSVAVSGVCLTATRAGDASFEAEVMNETLVRTSLAELEPGDAVNLELPLRASERFGGHIMQGHVDGMGNISDVEQDGFARRVRIEPPRELLRYVVEKGSIAVDGVSLTIAELDNDSFTVSLIPETLQRTTLGAAEPGTTVNLEVDVLAKYVERLLGARA
jgi:riboflavin synthase